MARLTVALTGGIASGKTTVANLFAKKRVPIIDSDQIARDLVQPGQPALAAIYQHWGKVSLQDDGSLNRTWLREKISQSAAQRQHLESLLHPLIFQRIDELVQAATPPDNYLLIAIPLLVETKRWREFHRVLLVDTPTELQLKRLINRDQCSRQQAQRMVSLQSNRKQRQAIANDIILNDGDLANIKKQVDQLHHTYCCLAQCS